MKTQKRVMFFIIVALVFMIVSSTLSFSLGNMDATLTVNPSSVSNLYAGQTRQVQATLSNDNWVCSMSCTWSTTQSKSGSTPNIEAGTSYSWNFDVVAPTSGSSPTQVELTVNCQAENTWNCGFTGSRSAYVTVYYSFCGDSQCTSQESCSSCTADCGCQTGYDCVSGTCQLKCGNGKKDTGETCSSCPQDVQCLSYERCQSGQCVTYCGNSKCESNENCGTCVADCGCSGSTRCESGGCVTYCGNNICESNEATSCKNDCDWCGDGECQPSESCSDCSKDCGVCKPSCGDGKCDSSESCSTCSKDCGVCKPICGDNKCDSSESCSTCSTDCGECPKKPSSTPSSYCGDNICQSTESCSACPDDCGECPKTQTAASSRSSKLTPDKSTGDAESSKTIQTGSSPQTTYLGGLVLTKNNMIIFIVGIVFIGALIWIFFKFIKPKLHKTAKKEHEKSKLNHCTKCGAKIIEDDTFCEKCGKKLK